MCSQTEYLSHLDQYSITSLELVQTQNVTLQIKGFNVRRSVRNLSSCSTLCVPFASGSYATLYRWTCGLRTEMNGFALIGEALLIWFRQVCLEKNLAQVSAFSFWSFQQGIFSETQPSLYSLSYYQSVIAR